MIYRDYTITFDPFIRDENHIEHEFDLIYCHYSQHGIVIAKTYIDRLIHTKEFEKKLIKVLEE